MITAIKERPILFSAPMIRAILEDRKTQTRRIVKPQPEIEVDDDGKYVWPCRKSRFMLKLSEMNCSSPFGMTGDRLWVRETWGPCEGGFCYRATEAPEAMPDDGKWHPSIHMFRHASRIDLEITGVRVERLNDISEEDAIAEGIQPSEFRGWHNYSDKYSFDHFARPENSFMTLWESINGPGSWEANPFVWVIEFKRLLSSP